VLLHAVRNISKIPIKTSGNFRHIELAFVGDKRQQLK
jgi:hypothetical protein